MASVGCSTGAELYSTVSFLRSARSDLHVVGLGIDISEGVVAAAREGVYRRDRPASSRGLFAPDPPEMSPDLAGCNEECWSALLTEQKGLFRVRDWVRDGTFWLVADACDPNSTFPGPLVRCHGRTRPTRRRSPGARSRTRGEGQPGRSRPPVHPDAGAPAVRRKAHSLRRRQPTAR
jgi:hypothetical protein